MDNTDSERKQKRREAYLIGLGAITGILGSVLFALVRDLIQNSPNSTVDFIAGLVTFALMYGGLKLALWERHPTTVNADTKPPSS